MGTTLTAKQPDTPFVAQVEAALARGEALEVHVGNATAAVDEETAALILTILQARASGRSVLLEALPDELTTGQVADLLGVTRPTVVAMTNRGELTARFIGTHRRIRTEEALRAREPRTNSRTAALDELTKLSVDAGLYD